MKLNYKHIGFLILMLLNSLVSFGQYNIDKEKYNFRTYQYQQNDKYNPIIAGVSSYIIPGLGQMYCNENKRGNSFLAGYTGGILLMMTGFIIDLPNMMSENNKFSLGEGLLIGGVVSTVGVQIWSTLDAVKVAKVKNMAIRDEKDLGMSLFLKPNLINNNFESLNLSLVIKL